MSAQQVLCRVRALYAYESTDPSSLSFKPNVILEVLAQLESGWWDGWYDGKRGWFPSNYVEVIDEAPQQILELEQPWHPSSPIRPRQRLNNHHPMEQNQKNQLRLSLYATDQLMTEPKETDWVLQTTEDGSDQYYYNARTQEMRNSIPPEGYLNENMQWMHANGNNNNNMNEMLLHQHHQQQQQQPRMMEKPVRPVRAANRVIDDQHQHHPFNTPISPRSEITFQRSSMDDMLPLNWIRKITPKGRYYYFNTKTEETTLELENIDPETGALMTTPVELLPSLPNQVHLDSALSETNNCVSWPILSSSLAQALFKLKESIQLGNTIEFNHQVTDIVHRIRFLLYVSGCLDKDTSIYLKSNKQLRNYHRTLLANVAKLVLSAKVASGTQSHDARIKLQIDTDEVLAAIREFMTCAQEKQLEIHESKPSLVYTGLPPPPKNISSTNTNRLNTANPEAITTFAENTKTALHSLMDNLFSTFSHFQRGDLHTTLDRLKVNAPLFVAQFRNLSNTASQFLNFIEQVCELHLPNERVTALTASKQPVYSAMGNLFIISQIITKSDIDSKQLEEVWANLEECSRTIEASIQDCVDIIKMKHQPPAPPPQLPTTPMPTVPPEDSLYQQQKHQKTSSTLGSLTSHSRSRHDSDKSSFMRKQQQEDGGDVESDIDENVNGVHVYSDQEPDEFDEEDDDDLSIENELGNVRPKTELKIFKFFGEDTIAAARRRDTTMLSPTSSTTASVMTGGNLTLNNSVANEVPWYMTSDIEPGDLIMNMEGNVKGGTLSTLIKKLTQHDQLDSKFNSTFLLTYRSFCTTEELFGHLFERYDLPLPENLTEEEVKNWNDKKLKLVRLRVFNVIKSWLETYFNDEEDRNMLPIIEKFTESTISQSMSFGAEQLTKVIRKRMSADDNNNQIKKMKLNVRTEDMPTPILPRNMKRIRLLELDPLELARQMTIMDFKLYVGIQPVECLDKNWGKPDGENGTHIAANVKASIEHSNQVTAWVTDSILSKDEVRKRSLVIKHWIYVAERCRMQNNFNTCMAILSAFDNGSIGRLKRTWEMISGRTMQILQNIRRVLGANRNFAEYRELIRKVNPPCLPFLGIYLQDLTFIEDGNTNFLKKTDDLINFAKRMKTADVIRDLQQYQSTHYMLNPVPDIQEFIQAHLYSSREEEELYNLSLKLEPRTKGEDTILKRLKESGL